MRPQGVLIVALVTALTAGAAQGAEPPALARARTLYNSADYDGAIINATIAQQQPVAVDAASLVLARAHLERYRRNPDPADLVAARQSLGAVRTTALTPRDQVDLLIGLGQSLFFGDDFGAAAELFDTALSRGALMPTRDRLLLLDWWASALDREAQTRPPERRGPIFDRIIARMENELREGPGSGPANYWLAVAARGAGDLDRAWDAAIAAWVRASLAPATSTGLRADIDRLIIEAVIPERGRQRAGVPPAEATASLRAEWETVKSQWK